MSLSFMTREVFDAIIAIVIIIGVILAFFRLRADLRRRVLPPQDDWQFTSDDTQPNTNSNG